MLNCNFSLNQDDIVNFHDRTSFVKKISERKVEIVGRRGMSYFNAQVADKLELFYDDVTPVNYTAKIILIDGNVMELDNAIPEPKGEGFLVANRSYETANILIKNCRFYNYYGRLILMGNNTSVENCLFQNGTAIPIRLLSLGYTMDKWSEGAGCSNIVVKNCVFDNNNLIANVPKELICDISCGASICSRAVFLKPANEAIKDILIEDNEFKNSSGLSMHIDSGKNIIFRNNIAHQLPANQSDKQFADSVMVKNGEGIYIDSTLINLDGALYTG